MKLLMGFVPVLHAGYLRFFRKHAEGKLLLFGKDLYGEFEHLTREIRALEPREVRTALEALQIFQCGVSIICRDSLWDLLNLPGRRQIIMPDEDISRHIAKEYLTEQNVIFESVFLRFDMPKTLSQTPVEPDREITVSDLEREFMVKAYDLAGRSPDWWRQVGAIAVTVDGKVLSAFNTHMPFEQFLYAMGDPRNNFIAGERIDLSSAHHAEKQIICMAAAEGIALAGSTFWITTFPCPGCASDLVTAKVSRVLYSEGYSLLAAVETLKANSVELVRVRLDGK